MSDHTHASSASVSRQDIANASYTVGWFGFWVQLVLTAVSIIILLFATLAPSFNLNTLKSGIGLFAAIGGVLALGVSIYWMFRYTRLAKQLQVAHMGTHPTKGEFIQTLNLGVMVNLVGMLFTLLSSQTVAGALLIKVLSIPQGTAIYQSNQLIEPLDIFVVQANICMIAAQFVGVVVSFWLLKRSHQ